VQLTDYLVLFIGEKQIKQNSCNLKEKFLPKNYFLF